jgi:hypothetical protein
MTAQQKISGRILVLMQNHMQATGQGKDVALRWAFDKVLGAGAFDALASDVYDAVTA